MTIEKASNRLKNESSPYLRQHASNPVDWYPWGREALDQARRENRPIFLSIGYSACHWCHVMERESFEDEITAALMNEHFINIKVDREERPDLDHIYMSAVQIMTQHGGWPMSVFLTPKLEPFYGGTYFPPEDRHGMPSFRKILAGVATAWSTRRDEISRSATQLVEALQSLSDVPPPEPGAAPLGRELVREGVRTSAQAFDANFGGFGTAPKFFHSTDLRLCLRHAYREGDPVAGMIVQTTLEKIRRGGIYDQLGGGFHRYSTDAMWLVPHFEKMLYDNALLLEVYSEAYSFSSIPLFAQTILEIADWLEREMTSADGFFFSTLDADTEGEEGKYYVWREDEIQTVLDPELFRVLTAAMPVTAAGNWEGKNILTLSDTPTENRATELGIDESTFREQLSLAKRHLMKVRNQRTRPHRDEKMVLSWAAMTITALTCAHRAVGHSRSLAAAQRAAHFILNQMKSPALTSQGLPLYFHTHKDGTSKLTAYLDDYAALGIAFINLYQSDFDELWLREASEIADTILDEFRDLESATFYYTGATHEPLITRPKEATDGAVPSATGQAASFLSMLGRIRDDKRLSSVVEKTLTAYRDQLRRLPHGSGQMLLCLDSHLSDGAEEWFFASGKDAEENEEVLRLVRALYVPGRLLLSADQRDAPIRMIPASAHKRPIQGQATLYVCRNQTCDEPWVGVENIRRKAAEFVAQRK